MKVLNTLLPDTISFFSLFIRVKEGGGVLGVLQKLIIKGEKYKIKYFILYLLSIPFGLGKSFSK